MDKDYITEFIQIVKNNQKEDELTKTTLDQLKTILLINNNLIEILFNIDEIDEELSEVNTWLKLSLYEFIFSEKVYKTILSQDLPKDKYMLFLSYSGLICETVKAGYYQTFMDKIISNNIEKDNLENHIEKAGLNIFTESRNNILKFIQIIYDNIKTHFQNDELFPEIVNFITTNGLKINL